MNYQDIIEATANLSQPVDQQAQDPQPLKQTWEAPANGPFLDAFYKSTPDPVKPNEKTLNRNTAWASVADGVATLAEMFATSKGARVKPRTGSAVQGVVGHNEKLRSEYEKKLEGYNSNRLRALYQDKQYELGEIRRKEDITIQDRRTQEGREYQQKDYENKTKLHEDIRQKNRKEDIEDYAAKQAISNKYISSRNTPSTGTKTGKTTYSPSDTVAIRKRLENVPIEDLRYLGLTTTKDVKDQLGRTTGTTEEIDWTKVSRANIEELAEITGYSTQGQQPAAAPWVKTNNNTTKKAPWVK